MNKLFIASLIIVIGIVIGSLIENDKDLTVNDIIHQPDIIRGKNYTGSPDFSIRPLTITGVTMSGGNYTGGNFK